MIDLAELEAKALAATQGEWTYRPQPYDDWGIIRVADPTEEGTLWYIAQVGAGRWVNDDEKNAHRRANTDPYHANAAYIVAAQPRVVLELIERVKTLEEALGALHGDSLDAIMEVIGEGEKFASYNLGKSKMRDWFLRRISALIARPEASK